MAYSACVLNGVREIVTDMRKRIGKDAKIDRIRLCIDEWGIVRDWNPAPDACGVGPLERYYPPGRRHRRRPRAARSCCVPRIWSRPPHGRRR